MGEAPDDAVRQPSRPTAAPSAVRRRAIPLACITLLVACDGPTDPPLPGGARRLAPPAVFATWWAMVEACAGVSRPLSGVQWWEVPDVATFATPDHGNVQAYWSAGSNQIVLAGAAASDGAVVRHEMLHALLRRAGHPRAEFLERCGGVVDCGASCVRDAGPAPAPDAATDVYPSALEVGVALAPAVPTAARDDGHFAVVVTARNPAPAAVSVLLRHDPFLPFRYGWGLVVAGPDGVVQLREPVRDPGLVRFAAGEEKRFVFDLVVGAATMARHVPAGTYTLTASFGGAVLTRPGVRIGP